jgi:hypothetical protein
MEAIMNKKVILFALLMGLSHILHVTASADSMYKDINNISENNINNIDLTSPWYEMAKDQQTGRSDLQRLLDLESVLSTLRWYRDIMQNKIAIPSSQKQIAYDCFEKADGFFIKNFKQLYLKCKKNRDYCFNKINCYLNKDKIAVLNSIILELENIETRLEEKVRPTIVTDNCTKECIEYFFIEDDEKEII